MIARWSDWKRFPRPQRGENIEAPICPGIYEIRVASTGALFRFGVSANIALTLSGLNTRPGLIRSLFGRSPRALAADLEYRTCATSTKAEAKSAAEGMLGRRDVWVRSVA